MKFQKAVKSDADAIIDIIKQAQNYFKKNGINQWQNDYPNIEVVRNDIMDGNGYVLINENRIVGTVAVSFEGEKTYDTIYDGEWLSHQKYVVIHRLAIEHNNKGLGLASVILRNIENICLEKDVHSIKVDTHEENKAMQIFLKKNGFKYCGIVYLADGSKRVAFEKML